MKHNGRIFLAIFALALAALACGETPAPTAEVKERVIVVTATPEPTRIPPTAAPAAAKCTTIGDAKAWLNQEYGITVRFAPNPEIAAWDMTTDLMRVGSDAAIYGINVDGDCVIAAGSTVLATDAETTNLGGLSNFSLAWIADYISDAEFDEIVAIGKNAIMSCSNGDAQYHYTKNVEIITSCSYDDGVMIFGIGISPK